MNWQAFWVSVSAAACATVIVTILGVVAGYAVAKWRFPGRGLLEAVCTIPIALPPTVVGYYLLVTLGGPGPIRDLSVAIFGHPLTFTFAGVVVAQSIEAFPYVFRAARVSIGQVDPRLEDACRVLGVPAWRIALQTTLPLASVGIAAGVAMAFGRAIGDFGATVAIAGYLPSTTTMPIAIFDAVFEDSGDNPATLALVQITIAVVILLAVSRLGAAGLWLTGARGDAPSQGRRNGPARDYLGAGSAAERVAA